MLGKLLKYEAKAGARLLPVVFVGMAGVFLIGLLAKALKIVQVQATTSTLLVLGAVAVVILALVLAVLRYHKGLFGAEGYLTQTLPVSKGQLILSKLIAAYLWIAVSVLAAVLAAAGVLYLNDADLAPLADALFGQGMTPLVICGVVLFFIQLLAFFGELYFAVTLANTRAFLRNNVAFAFVFYLVANFAVGLLELAGMLLIPAGLRIGETGVSFTTDLMLGSLVELSAANTSGALISGMTIGLGSGLVDLLAGIGLLLAARWLLTHKTSVK